MTTTLTIDRLREVLDERFGGILTHGQHCEDGRACVRELRAAALALPWSDHPDGDTASVTDRCCQILNDAAWSSDAARTEGCLPLALLSEATAAPSWEARYTELTIRRLLPWLLRRVATIPALAAHSAALQAAADKCEREGTAAAAYAAAADAARAAAAADAAAYAAYAADAARAAAAADAAADAAYAAYADADAYAADAARDEILRIGVACLVEAQRVENNPAPSGAEGERC